MATNNPPPATQQQEEQMVLVRGSAEYQEYMRHQGGRIKAVVNGIEDFLSVSGRTLLLVFVLYTTVKGGMTVTGHQVPWFIDILMLGFQVCGLEGSIPGLSRFRESLLLKNTQVAKDDAETIRKTIKSARTLNFLTGVEIMLAAYAASHNAAIPVPGLSVAITIANLSEFYGYVLLLARLWFITSFIIEMSRLEVKKPKIISQAEYDKQQHEAEQAQIRKDNEAIQAEMRQALHTWTQAQHQQHQARFNEALATWMTQKSQECADLVASAKQPQEVDVDALTASVFASLSGRLDQQVASVKQENEALISRRIASVKQESEALLRQQLVSVKQESEAAPRRHADASTNPRQEAAPVASLPGLLSLPDRAVQKAEALKLVDSGVMSTYKAAEQVGVPSGTIQRWLKERKEEGLKLVDSGQDVAQVASKLGVTSEMVQRWLKEREAKEA
jgi:hypothetical protein